MDEGLQQQAEVMRAVSQALARRDEVFSLLWQCRDRLEAVGQLQHLLTIDELGARAVLDLSWNVLLEESRSRLASQLTRHEDEGRAGG